MKIALAVLPLVFAGCATDDIPLVHMKDGGLSVGVSDNMFVRPDPLMIALSRFGDDPPTNAAKPSDCVQISASTKITVNGMPGTLASVGSFDDGDTGIETNCRPPSLTFDVADPRPATLDIELDDGTAQPHVGVSLAASGFYTVITRCDFASCAGG